MSPFWSRRKDKGGDRESRERAPEQDRDEQYLRLVSSWEKFTGILDKKGRLQFATEAAVTQLGYSHERILGLPFWEAAWFGESVQSQKMAEDSIKRALEGDRVEWEAEVFAQDGRSFPVLFKAGTLMGRERDIIGIEAEPKALLEQKEAAWEVEEARERFDALLGMIQEGYFRVDRDGRFTVVSPSAAEVLGYDSPGELVGMTTAEIWADPQEKAEVEKLLAGEQRVDQHSASLKTKDGEAVSVELDMHLLFDHAGEEAGSEGVFRSIPQVTVEEMEEEEEEEEVEEELAEPESEFREMAELVKDVYFRADKDGILTLVSSAGARGFGYDSAEELIGLDIAELWVYSKERQKFLRQLNKEDEVVGWKGTFKRKDGEHVAVELDCYLVRDEDGEVVGTQGTFRDIDEVVKYEEELEDAYADLEKARAEIERLEDEKAGQGVEPEGVSFSLVERANDGVILIQDSIVRFANDAMVRMTGYSGAELTDMEFSMLLAEDSVDAGVEMYEAVVAGEVPEICELEFLTQDGETVLVEVGSSPVEHEGKSAALLIVRDLSTRKWPEEVEEEPESVDILPVAEEPRAAGKLEEMYAAVAEHSSDGIAIIKGPNMQELAFVNDQGLRMVGYTYKQMSKEVEERGAAFWFSVIDASDPAVVQALTEQYQRGASFEEGGIPWVELDVRRQDGTVVPAEMGLSGFELEGEPAYVVFIRDVTDKRNAEEERREAEARYRSIFDQSLELITISDLEGRLLDANDCLLELLGYTREEFTGASYTDIIHPDDLAKATEVYTETIEKGASQHPVEMRLITKSGEEVWIDFVGTCLRRGDEPYAVLVIARDITDRIRWDRTLEQSEQRLKEALAKLRVSHEEISTPVVQMWDHVLALPLIGVVDDARAQRVMEVLLNRIVETQSELVILDVTGVASIDTHVTDRLVKTIKSCSLLGAQCVVTGISPEMAQTIASLGLDSRGLVIKKDLQYGLRWSLRKMGYELRKRS